MKWIVSLIVLAAGGYFGWAYYQGTPSYSVAQINKSIETNDVYLFRKHVDTQAVVKDMLQGAMGDFDELDGKNEDEPAWANALGKGIFAALLPAMTNYISDEIEEHIKTGEEPFTEFGSSKKTQDDSGEAPPPGTEQVSSKFNLEQFEDPEFGFRDQGSVTLLVVNHLNPKLGKRYDLIFAMQDMDGHWKVVGVDNAKEYFQQQKSDEAALLEAINEPIRAKLADAASLSPTNLRVEKPYFSTVVVGTIATKNQSPEAIASLEYELVVAVDNEDIAFRELIEATFDPPLSSNDEKVTDIQLRLNNFMSEDKAFAKAVTEPKAHVSARIAAITYASGEVVELKTALDQE